jgi:hypothetical protein
LQNFSLLAVLDGLAKDGKVRADSRAIFGTVGISVVVKEGAARPDISQWDANRTVSSIDGSSRSSDPARRLENHSAWLDTEPRRAVPIQLRWGRRDFDFAQSASVFCSPSRNDHSPRRLSRSIKHREQILPRFGSMP